MNSLPHIRCLRFRFKARDSMTLAAFKGSPWRGLFGATLKSLTCPIRNTQCHQCLLKTSCLYRSIFESPEMVENKRFVSGASHWPHPFFLLPPLDERRYIPSGDVFTSKITLIGPALQAVPQVILTFREMGRKGIGSNQAKFDMIEVDYQDGEQWITCYQAEEESFQLPPSPPPTLLPSPNGHVCRQVRLTTSTPVCIKHGGSLIENIDFPIMILAVLRRLDDLSRLYGEGPLPVDIPELIAKAAEIQTTSRATHWTHVQRYSSRQKTTMKLGGVEGEMVFQGDLRPFYPWLTLGEKFMVGKATSFGFGCYRLEWDQ